MKYIDVNARTMQRVMQSLGRHGEPTAQLLPDGRWRVPVDDYTYQHLQTAAQVDQAIRRALLAAN